MQYMGRINERDAGAVGSQAADGGVEWQGIKSGEKKEKRTENCNQRDFAGNSCCGCRRSILPVPAGKQRIVF